MRGQQIRLTKPPTAKQQASGRTWNPWAPGRYQQRVDPPVERTSWWTEPDFEAAYMRELPRLLAMKVPGSKQPESD